MMKKLLNTLYVTTPDAYLRNDGENLLVTINQEERMRVPIHILDGVVYFGYLGASPGAIRICTENGVSLSFLSNSGRFLGRVEGPKNGNVLLRKEQYRVSDDTEKSARLASRFITGKLLNCRTSLLRVHRERQNEDMLKIESVIAKFADLSKASYEASNLDTIRGIEGDGARAYFSVINDMIYGQEGFAITSRNRRPPLDPTNSLLSFVYTLLSNQCASALEAVGLDPAVGFLHRDRPGRRSLALDLMEELRPVLADRFVLTLINRKQVQIGDFEKKENGAVVLKEDSRKTLIEAWQKRKQETITHPYLNEKFAIGLLPHAQALLLARHIRGDIEEYPAFIWR
jgi:CRISPR-associated protein Cas1